MVLPAKRAIVLVLQEKAEVLRARDEVVRSEQLSLPLPSVLRLRYYVHVRFQLRTGVNRKAIFARDGHTCQYCGGVAENIDHIVPRSRGGAHIWSNVVASCRRCNTRKENKTPEEAGMRLRRRPGAPLYPILRGGSYGRIDPEWEPYFRAAASA
ncbi:MAG: HNH endonuclease [Acidimicrobiia bacterium]